MIRYIFAVLQITEEVISFVVIDGVASYNVIHLVILKNTILLLENNDFEFL